MAQTVVEVIVGSSVAISFVAGAFFMFMRKA